jgi:hypothetical protein
MFGVGPSSMEGTICQCLFGLRSEPREWVRSDGRASGLKAGAQNFDTNLERGVSVIRSGGPIMYSRRKNTTVDCSLHMAKADRRCRCCNNNGGICIMMQQSPSTVDTGDHFVLNSLRERPTAFHAAPKVGRKIQYGNPEPSQCPGTYRL